MKRTILALTAAGAMGAAMGATNIQFKAGGDIRLRHDVTDALPKYGRTEADASSYGRYRFRVYGEIDAGDAKLYGRVADEFRWYKSPSSNNRKQGFPDVLFIDQLYFSYKGLFDALDLTLGRQEIIYGSKRIVSDGTGGDGSRSKYFDGARFAWHVDEDRTLDFFAVYCAADDYLPTLGREHQNGKKPAHYDQNGYLQDEYGAGIYYQDRATRDFGYDLYFISKGERRGCRSKFRSEGADAFSHTFGTRLLPRWSDRWSSEFELAGQAGTDSLLAANIYGDLTYAFKADCKPKLTGALWLLTGDAEGDRGGHAWHAVFNRETGTGEAVVPMYNKYDYTNLVYPHLKFGVDCGDFSTLKLQAGPMFTAVREKDAGNSRGLFGQLRYEMKLDKLFGCDTLKGGTFAFQGEWFDKGGYFQDGNNSSAFFARAEIGWKF